MVIVSDEEGNVPFNVYTYRSLPNNILYRFDTSADSHIDTEKNILNFQLPWSMASMAGEGNHPSWVLIAQSHVECFQAGSGDSHCYLSLDHFPNEDCDVVVSVSCDYMGQHWETVETVHFVSLPVALPAGITPDVDTVTLPAGSFLKLDSMFAFTDGWSIPDVRTYVYLQTNDVSLNYKEAEDGVWYPTVPSSAGSYEATLILQAANLIYSKPVTLQVTQAEEPVGTIEVSTFYAEAGLKRDFYIGMPYQDLYSGDMVRNQLTNDCRIDHLVIENSEELQGILSGNPVWTITSDGPVEYKLYTMGIFYGEVAEIVVPVLPASPVTDTFHVTCTWDTLTWESDYTVSYKLCPNGLPSGIAQSADPYVVKVNEAMDSNSIYSFAGGWALPGTTVEAEFFYDDRFSSTDEGLMYASQPGIYDLDVSVRCGNLYWVESRTIYVTREDGTLPEASYVSQASHVLTLPASLTVLDAEAFYGTSAEKAVLPENCTTIGEKAFGHAANLKEINLPASLVSIADNAFEGCGTVFAHVSTDSAKQYCLQHGLIPVN